MEKNTPWHNEPYVWLVILFPLLAIVGGMVTIYLAISSDDGLVVDDYYKKGLEINKTLQRDIQAEIYGLKADTNIDHENGQLTIKLAANKDFHYPAQLNIQLLHATRKNYDQNLTANKILDTEYQSSIYKLNKGTWYILIEGEDWRLINTLTIK